jgi:hypothetical protein
MFNNSLIQYGDLKVYTSDKILLIIKILVVEHLSKADSIAPLFNFIINELGSNNRLDLDKIDVDLKNLGELQDSLISIYKRIKEDGAYYTTNEFAHEIYKVFDKSLDRKSIKKIIGELTNSFDAVLLQELIKIIRISYREEPFKTERDLSMDILNGSWASIKIDSIPDYDINWNMTDYWVSYSYIRLEITSNECSVIIPALDYTTKAETLLSLIHGNVSVSNGFLIIEREKLKSKIPVLQADDDTLTLFIFKTNVQFKKVKRKNGPELPARHP